MRTLLFSLLFLLALPLCFGEVDVSINQDNFNIGDSIEIESSAQSDLTLNGFMRLTSKCTSFSLPFFMTPIDLVGGYRVQVEIPNLKVLPSMKGVCSIEAEILDGMGQIIDSGNTQSFTISDGLNIILLTENLTTLPGSAKKIEGIVRGASENTLNADIALSFDEEIYTTTTFNGKFIVLLGIPSNVKSGLHSLKITAQNTQENKGEANTQIEVIAVPTTLQMEVLEETQDPSKNITYTSSLFDQAGDPLSFGISLGIRGPDDVYLFKGEVQSGVQNTYLVPQFLAPGEYTVESSFGALKANKAFLINTIREAKVSADGSIISIENIGNIPYEERLEIFLEGDSKTYTLREDVKVLPGKVEVLDLSKEVPTGNYNIFVPKNTALKVEGEGSAAILGKQLLASNVRLEDHRSAIKKAGSSLSAVTGRVIGSNGAFASSGWLAPLTLLGIVVGLGLFYTRDLWFWLLRGRR